MIRVLRQQIRERLQSLLERNPVLTLHKQRLQAGQDQRSALGRQQKPRRMLVARLNIGLSAAANLGVDATPSPAAPQNTAGADGLESLRRR
jgi:hypothetical protein